MYYDPYPFRISEFVELHAQKTPRKMAAALRAIRRLEDREKGRDPLFDDGVRMSDAEVREKAEERFERYRAKGIEMVRRERLWQAMQWMKLRRCRNRVPQEVKRRFDALWRRQIYPGRPTYALDLMRRLLVEYYGLLTDIETPLFDESNNTLKTDGRNNPPAV